MYPVALRATGPTKPSRMRPFPPIATETSYGDILMSAAAAIPHPGTRIKAEVIPPGMSVTKAAQLMGVGRPAWLSRSEKTDPLLKTSDAEN